MSSETSPLPLPPVSSDEFRHVLSRFASGVTIATVLDSSRAPHGLTVSSFTSVSLHPPLILICLGHAITMIDAFRAAKYFGVNILSEHQQPTSDRFARKAGDRFESLAWERGITGAPLLPDALASIECSVYDRHTAGDHDILIGMPVATRTGAGNPLLYYSGRYRRLEP